MDYAVYLSARECIIFTQVPKELGSMDHLEPEMQKVVTSMMWVLCAEHCYLQQQFLLLTLEAPLQSLREDFCVLYSLQFPKS